MKRTSRSGKVVHNLGISAWFGGLMFGQVSLNPTVSSISNKSECGRVLNEARSRSNIVNPRRCSQLCWAGGSAASPPTKKGSTNSKETLVNATTRTSREVEPVIPPSGIRNLVAPDT
jgi:hypothetical protein